MRRSLNGQSNSSRPRPHLTSIRVSSRNFLKSHKNTWELSRKIFKNRTLFSSPCPPPLSASLSPSLLMSFESSFGARGYRSLLLGGLARSISKSLASSINENLSALQDSQDASDATDSIDKILGTILPSFSCYLPGAIELIVSRGVCTERIDLEGIKKSIEGLAKRTNYGLGIEDLKDGELPDGLSSIPNVSFEVLSTSLTVYGTHVGLPSDHRVYNFGFGRLTKIDSKIY